MYEKSLYQESSTTTFVQNTYIRCKYTCCFTKFAWFETRKRLSRRVHDLYTKK